MSSDSSCCGPWKAAGKRLTVRVAGGCRLGEVSRRLQSLRQTTSAQSSADAILEQMQRDVKDLQTKVRASQPRQARASGRDERLDGVTRRSVVVVVVRWRRSSLAS